MSRTDRTCNVCGSLIPQGSNWCPACGADMTGYTFDVSRKLNERMEREFMEGINTFRDLGNRYGGMPPQGGMHKMYNEYVVGIAQMAEALHCILGSIYKIVGYEEEWQRGLSVEKGHIREEMKKVNFVMSEYSRDLYIQSQYEGGVWKEGEKAIKYLRKKMEDLALQAARKKQQTIRLTNMPEPIQELAIQTYDVIRIMAIKVKRNVEGRRYKPAENVFNDKQLIEEVKNLDRKIDKVLQKYI